MKFILTFKTPWDPAEKQPENQVFESESIKNLIYFIWDDRPDTLEEVETVSVEGIGEVTEHFKREMRSLHIYPLTHVLGTIHSVSPHVKNAEVKHLIRYTKSLLHKLKETNQALCDLDGLFLLVRKEMIEREHFLTPTQENLLLNISKVLEDNQTLFPG